MLSMALSFIHELLQLFERPEIEVIREILQAEGESAALLSQKYLQHKQQEAAFTREQLELENIARRQRLEDGNTLLSIYGHY